MVLSCGQYKTMDSAPKDGSVILVLTDSKHPYAAYWDGDEDWRYWHSDNSCNPRYWADLPAEVPAGFLEDESANDEALTVQYQPIATAPTDDAANIILVLIDPALHPVAAYYDSGWKAVVGDGALVPDYWIPTPTLPGDYPA